MHNRPQEMFSPACGKTIDCETCYELVMCLAGFFKIQSVPEVKIADRDAAKKICDQCPYSDID